MKRILLIFLLVFLYGISFGQYDFDLGIKVGLNNSKITVNSEQFTPSTITEYHAGLFARFNLNRIYIQPEVYYSTKGGNIEEILDENPFQVVNEFNYNVIDAPLLIGVNILNKTAFKLRAMGGPVFSFLTDSSVEPTDPRFSTEYFKNHFFGWQYGLGVDFLFLTFDARIENSFGNIYSSTTLDSRNNTFLLSLGLKIL